MAASGLSASLANRLISDLAQKPIAGDRRLQARNVQRLTTLSV